jgi:hypothetical protein
MKPLRSTAALIVLAAACFSTASGAGQQNVQRVPGDAKNCVPPATRGATSADAKARPPLIRVCVSDSDTQLNLPWFLTDTINAVNAHESAGDLLHKIKNGF